jgi:predicted PurR-regulated permease PerM
MPSGTPVTPDSETPLEASNWPVAVLAVLGVLFMLYWARAVCIPIMIGVLISYALSPLVNRLHRWHIPRAIGAAVLLLGFLSSLGALSYSLGDDAAALIETLPEVAQNLRGTLRREGVATGGAIENMQQAADQLQRAADESGGGAADAPSGVTRVQIERPGLDVRDILRVGTLGAVAIAGQASVVVFLVFFLLTAGDTFRRKVVKIAGPTLAKKRITLGVLDEINGQIQRYLVVHIGTSVLVGVATWLAFLWIGVEHAAIWGVAAAVFNTVPYIGPVLITGGTTVVALLQFGTLAQAVLVGAVALLITSLEGYLLTPWLTGRASRMNPVAIFVGVLLWGWLWGVWGLLLAVPIIMVVKAICDQVDDLKPVGELLGE